MRIEPQAAEASGGGTGSPPWHELLESWQPRDDKDGLQIANGSVSPASTEVTPANGSRTPLSLLANASRVRLEGLLSGKAQSYSSVERAELEHGFAFRSRSEASDIEPRQQDAPSKNGNSTVDSLIEAATASAITGAAHHKMSTLVNKTVSEVILESQKAAATMRTSTHQEALATINQAKPWSLLQAATAVQMYSVTKTGITILIVAVCVLLFWLVNLFKAKAEEDQDGEQPDEQQPSAEQNSGSVVEQQVETNAQVLTSPLLYIMAGRVKDKTVLATRSLVDEKARSEIETNCKKLLVASKQKLTPGTRDKLTASSFFLYYSLDKKGEFLVCLAVRDATYPEKYAYQCMKEFQSCVQGVESSKTCEKGVLTDVLAMRLDELFSKFETPWTLSTYGKLLGKTAEVKEHLNEGITTAQDVGKSMSVLERKTANMTNIAQSFHKTSGVAKWRYQLEQYKFYIKACIVTAGLSTVLFVWTFY